MNLNRQTTMPEAVKPEVKEHAPSGRVQPLVMPVDCGRYLWDDEPVTVYWQDDKLIGETSTECDTVEALDLIFRTDNSMQNQITVDAPWQRVGDCYEEDCESARHNVKGMAPGSAVPDSESSNLADR